MPNKYEKYYRTLDLDVGASKEDVKKAFRELSHIWHPDNHMGKSSNVQNRANEQFKEISNAYQVLKDFLSEEGSSREAEEKRKAEQDRKDREEEERKQQEENERRKREEESRSEAEQDRREREEKEHKYWEEQAKKKHEEEKNKQKNKVSQVNDFSWGRDFWSWAWFFPSIFLIGFLYSIISDLNGDSRSGKASRQQSEVKTEGKHSQNNATTIYPSDRNFQSDSFSWTRDYVGNIYGKHGLTMHLQRDGNDLTGTYQDIHEMKEKRLRGYVRENSGIESFSLAEFLDSKRTGTFVGKFTSERAIEGEWVSEVDPTDKTLFKLEEMNTRIDTDPKYKISGDIYTGDTSIYESLESNGSQQCGNHTLFLKEEQEDGYSLKHILIKDDRGTAYETASDQLITIVACVDLTGDGKPELFLETHGGGNNNFDFREYVYLLDDPIRRLFAEE